MMMDYLKHGLYLKTTLFLFLNLLAFKVLTFDIITPNMIEGMSQLKDQFEKDQNELIEQSLGWQEHFLQELDSFYENNIKQPLEILKGDSEDSITDEII